MNSLLSFEEDAALQARQPELSLNSLPPTQPLEMTGLNVSGLNRGYAFTGTWDWASSRGITSTGLTNTQDSTLGASIAAAAPSAFASRHNITAPSAHHQEDTMPPLSSHSRATTDSLEAKGKSTGGSPIIPDEGSSASGGARGGARGPLTKYWCFTSYRNERPDKPTQATYFVIQQEKCETTGRLHWQGYVEFPNKKLMHLVKSYIGDPAAHLEVRRGNAQQAADYCKKSKTAVLGTLFEEGTISKPETSIWEGIKDGINAGMTLEQIVDEFTGAFLRYPKGIMKMIEMKQAKEPATFMPVRVMCLYGRPGCGKTKYAFDLIAHEFGGVSYTKYYQKGQASWWDGYCGQRCVLIDDFEGDAPINELLQLTDGYGHNKFWPVKGAFIRMKINTIIFTSNHHPREWYSRDYDQTKVDAVLRRIPTIITNNTAYPMQYIKVEPELIE